jgi:hypothetical protein
MVLLAVAGLAKPQTGQEASQEGRMERVLNGLRPPIAGEKSPIDKLTPNIRSFIDAHGFTTGGSG